MHRGGNRGGNRGGDRGHRESKKAARRSKRTGGERRTASAGRSSDGGGAPDDVFAAWEDLLRSRQDLRRRLDAICAVHGWEGRALDDAADAASRKGSAGDDGDDDPDGDGATFLGGIDPRSLIAAARAEADALGPAAASLERADLALALRESKRREAALSDDRDRLAEELAVLREECFEAREEAKGRSDELEELRRSSAAVGNGKDAAAAEAEGEGRAGAPRADAQGSGDDFDASSAAGAFDATLSRDRLSEGRRVVEALSRLKLPNEAAMGPAELACWRENKKTIANSLKTISGQIYSATARILYEVIQNADDCAFDGAGELYLECGEEAFVAFHNEVGFQPKDLYSMCQVGESSKVPGSGKIGRKGIGFKSVFQISDRPMIVSPPFQFCFDVEKNGIFGFIVPTWVGSRELERRVPPKLRGLVRRIFPDGLGDEDAEGDVAVSKTGTLLVCPKASRLRSLDLMHDNDFDGLSLAFLKNLEKITFVSSSKDCASTTHEYHMERTPVVFDQELEHYAIAGTVLKGIVIQRHDVFNCTIVERVSEEQLSRSKEIRRHYRLHSYSVLKFKSDVNSARENLEQTMQIDLAYPVDENSCPRRTDGGELVFAYLPVTAAGFGFAINADFDLVASRQEVQDSHPNLVILGRIPPLFVHAILSDEILGEDAFPFYLPDIDAVRKEARSGGGRKWFDLGLALHRETASWLTIPTEDEPEKAKRRNVVLRPPHLSSALVSNGTLKAVTGGEMNFAHACAVRNMNLECCIKECPITTVLDCIRLELERTSIARKSDAGTCATLRNDILLDVWRYLSAEYKRAKSQGASGQQNIREITKALIGGTQSADSLEPLRIFPIRGSTTLREHSQHGVPLCLDIGNQIKDRGDFATRLAEKVMPLFDTERLKGVAGLEELLQFMRLHDATLVELEGQIRYLFRFGLHITVDPDDFWCSFRYALSLGYANGLVDLVGSDVPIALPLQGSSVLSSKDTRRLSQASLPCILGLHRRPISASKYVLAIPRSASVSWGAMIAWELSMVKTFGVSYPRADVSDHKLLSSELLHAISDARGAKDAQPLQDLVELFDVYEQRMGNLVVGLRSDLESSHVPEECLLEKRPAFRPFSQSCSPSYIDAILEFTELSLLDVSFHAIRDFLGEALGVLCLKSSNNMHEGNDTCGSATSDECDLLTWDLASRLLGFRQCFQSSDTAWLLYCVLTPALMKGEENANTTCVSTGGSASFKIHHKPFLSKLAKTAFTWNGKESARVLWPFICDVGGFWLGSGFVALNRCVWLRTEEIWDTLQMTGCRDGPIVDAQAALIDLLGREQKHIVDAIGHFCIRGLRQNKTTKLPSLPFPSDLEMMIDNVLPWILECDLEKLAGGVNRNTTSQNFSEEIIQCYRSIVYAALSGLPSHRRWKIPVANGLLHPIEVFIDRRTNRRLSDLFILPDSDNWPESTAFCLRHFSSECIHPTLTPFFYPIADRQSVGLETPCARVKQTLRHCMRLAYSDIQSGTDLIWKLVSEITNSGDASIELSDESKWELLMWAAITCATKWLRMKEEGLPEDASHYQETLSRVRQLVPFVEMTSGGRNEQWSFLSQRHLPAADSSATDSSSHIMILRTLFGFELWQSTEGIELFGSRPSFTASIPSFILNYTQISLPETDQSFPEAFDEMSLLIIWEWFVMEMGAQSPSVLWETGMPIVEWVRPRIRATEASIRNILDGHDSHDSTSIHVRHSNRPLLKALLANILDRTHIDLLMQRMDAADEVRREAAAREAEARRQERIAVQERRRLEAETRRRNRLRERAREQLESEQRMRAELEDQDDTATVRPGRNSQISPPPTPPLIPSLVSSFRTMLGNQFSAAQNDDGEQDEEHESEQQMEPDLVHQDVPSARATENDGVTHGVELSFEMLSLLPPALLNRFPASPPAPVSRHTEAPVMRQSLVKGKLIRFLAGMRAYEMQPSSDTRRLPPILTEFVVWAGDFVSGDGSAGAGDNQRSSVQSERAAQRYLNQNASMERNGASRLVLLDDDDSDHCCICFLGLHDASVYDEVGEPVATACGHCFHAVCLARLMESSETDVWCPLCRSGDMAARFV